MYVIQNNETGMYVTPSGSQGSYTARIEQAQTYASREAAKRSGVCGNESIRAVAEIMPAPKY